METINKKLTMNVNTKNETNKQKHFNFEKKIAGVAKTNFEQLTEICEKQN